MEGLGRLWQWMEGLFPMSVWRGWETLMVLLCVRIACLFLIIVSSTSIPRLEAMNVEYILVLAVEHGDPDPTISAHC